jgi:hypothetical protein
MSWAEYKIQIFCHFALNLRSRAVLMLLMLTHLISVSILHNVDGVEIKEYGTVGMSMGSGN